MNYISTVFAMPDETKVRQETASLARIDDSFKKIIVVKDDIMPKRGDDRHNGFPAERQFFGAIMA